MTISVRCACGAKLKAKDSLAGKKVACPKCKQPLVIAAFVSPKSVAPTPLATGGDGDDPLGLPAGDNFGNAADPFASAGLGDELGLSANEATGGGLDLGDFSATELGAGAAAPLGTPMKLSSPAARPSSSREVKKTPALDQRVLIAAIGGGGALLLLLVGSVVAWMVFSGETEVAENTSSNNGGGSVAVEPSMGAAAPGMMPSSTPNQSPPTLPDAGQPSVSFPGGPVDAYGDAAGAGSPIAAYGDKYAGVPDQQSTGGPAVDVASAPAESGGVDGSASTGNPGAPIAPASSDEKVWFVLSDFRVSPPDVNSIEVSVDWKLVQGRVQPGKKYLVYVNFKVVNGFVSSMKTIEIDANATQGSAKGSFPARDANGFLAAKYAVAGDEEGLGYRSLMSGELKVGGGPTDAPQSAPGTQPDSEPPRVSSNGTSNARVTIQDSVAICVFTKSGKEYKLGTANGDQVTLFATYGSLTVAMKDLEDIISGIVGDIDGWRQEQRAIGNALFSQQLPGIWIVESVLVDGKAQAARADDPNYLILRDDKTFRIVKRGLKPEGTWGLNAEGQLLLNATNDDPKTAKMKRLSRDKLELTIVDGRVSVELNYGRSGLTTEP